MATERLPMRKTREILRLKELKRSHREISRALGVGGATVSEAAARARAAQLDWAAITAMSDAELEARLYPKPGGDVERPRPDPARLDIELRKTGVTLRLLHHEYLEQNRVGSYGYATAISKWMQSYVLSGEPGLLYDIGQAQRKAADCTHALSSYKRFIELDPSAKKRDTADNFVMELETKCGAVTQAPHVEDPSTGRGRTLKLAGLVTGGGGVTLVVTGLVFGLRASTLGDQVTSACVGGCDWAALNDKDARSRRYATTGYVLDTLGVAAIAAGAITYYLGHQQAARVVIPTPREGGVVVIWSGSL